MSSASSSSKRLSSDEPFSEVDIFYEILDSEVFVDVAKLRKASRNGIPDQLRPIVWKYLLGIEKPDRSNELSLRKERAIRYLEMDKTDTYLGKKIRAEVNRYFQRLGKTCVFDQSEDPTRFESIICAYLNTNNQIEYNTSFVQLCAPFVHIIPEDYDAYYCFERLMSILESLEDLEHSEIKSIIFRLPEIDIPSIINHATNLRSKMTHHVQ
ncbi:putative mitotic check point protein BUB2 [Smittium culicis]|uniref:Putative mitotic check point protein BUB2 n=1 Tax=Smittium culicis TaxID=133412 RepID=A0A1R1Y7P8_9FUNG|nr:putative mitotic check point protein BUB2 [Smittium culicis]